MRKVSCTLTLIMTLGVSLTACSIGQVDWENKMAVSDRKSTVNGMLNELRDFESQQNLLTKSQAKQDVAIKISQVDLLLSLDRRPVNEGDDAKYLEAFEAVSTARKTLSQKEDALKDVKLKKAQAEQNISDAQDVVKAIKRSINKYRAILEDDESKADRDEVKANLEDAKLDLADAELELKDAQANAQAALQVIAGEMKSANDAVKQAKEISVNTYRAQAANIAPFIQAKLRANRKKYAGLIIEVFNKSYNDNAPCRLELLVDALRMIGSAMRDDLGAENFKRDDIYKDINGVFERAIKQDITQPPIVAISVVNTVTQWGGYDRLDYYLTLLKQDGLDFELKDAILKMLNKLAQSPDGAKVKDKIIPPLKKVLMTDPSKQPVYYIGYAAKSLAELGEQSPEFVERLIECLWLDDVFGRNANAKCRLALNMLPSKLVGPIAQKALKRMNSKVEERAARLNYAHTGLIEAKSAEILSDVHYKGAVSDLIKVLKREDTNPEAFTKEPANTEFIKGQVQKMISVSKSLAVFGQEEAVNPLVSFLTNKDEKDPVEYKLAASQQLAYLGESSAIKPLLKIYQKKMGQDDTDKRRLQVQYGKTITLLMSKNNRALKGFNKSVNKDVKLVTEWLESTEEQKKKFGESKTQAEAKIKELEAEIKALGDKGTKLPEKPKREKVSPKVAKEQGNKAYDKAMKAAEDKYKADVDAYLKALSEDQMKLLRSEEGARAQKREVRALDNKMLNSDLFINLYKSWIKDYNTMLAQLKVIQLTSSDSQWADRLNDKEIEIRKLATYVLSRTSTSSSVASKALIKRLTDENDVVVRDLALFGLSRHARNSDVTALETAHKALKERDSRKPTDELKAVLYTLELLIAQLKLKG